LPTPASTTPPQLLILGAHPDDAEFYAGGLAALYRDRGYTVKMVSVTGGDAGHFRLRGTELAAIRREEARTAAAVIGAAYDVWDFPDGRLLPTLEVRERIIREIRAFRPDLVLTHRPCDYHPDHRAVGQAVQDASYMVTVPAIVPDAPHLKCDPVVAYLPDRFTRPSRLRGDAALDVGRKVETIVAMLACHRSQMFEWLPFNRSALGEVPSGEAERRGWLDAWFRDHLRPMAVLYRRELMLAYGPERGGAIEFAEVFEVSEYASPLTPELRRRLFPFLP